MQQPLSHVDPSDVIRKRSSQLFVSCPCEVCRQSDAIELVPDALVTGFDDRSDSVAVTTADGRTFSGSALVAADGVRSFFRQKLIGDGEPRPSGYVGKTHVAAAAF
jgi:2-polyprenyl-6-methoxyphenol hydroxylase-like FAD-dependent oxidoreductase